MHIKLKAILDLDTIVCLIRTLLYGEIEIHATQCQLNILRRIQGVFRSFQMSSDDCRFSQDVLGIFFLVFLKIFSGWSGGSIGLVGPSGSLGPGGWV